jgi:succinylglutamate desuccinylase
VSALSADRRFIQQNAARCTNGRSDGLRRSIVSAREWPVWAGSGGSTSFGERQKSPAMLALDLHEMEDRYWRDRGCHAGRHGYLKS